MSIRVDELLLEDAVARTLESMCFACVMNRQPEWTPDGTEQTAAVKFAGDSDGRLWLQASQNTTVALAASFLGEEEPEIDAARSQAVLGELANMVCGFMLGHSNPNGHFDLGAPDMNITMPVAADYAQTYELDCGSLRVAVVLQ